MRKTSKILAVILIAVMVLSNFSFTILAETEGLNTETKTSEETADSNDSITAMSIAESKSIYDLGVSRSTDFNQGWKFYRDENGSSPAGAEEIVFDDSSWRKLDLPHDWSIELDFNKNSPGKGEAGFLDGGVGWYRKTFTLPQSMNGKRININFDGIYMNSTLYVNGDLVGTYPNGYLPIRYDITDLVKTDGLTPNVIAVKVNHNQPTSRWYSGSGISRDVTLVVTDNVHVKNYGTYITTPNIESEISSGKVNVNVKTNIKNESDKEKAIILKNTIYDSESNIIGESTDDAEKKITPNGELEVIQTVEANNPKLWDIDSPNIYKMVTEVTADGNVVDIYESRFGFRWFSATANDGFELNGRYIKLNGVCMHHDQGALGAVQNSTAMERQMQIMKDMGVNAIRITHCPASTRMLEICDEKGLLVIDEAFDTWYGGKLNNDYHLYFERQASTVQDSAPGMTWAEYDVKKMVDRGKNNPSVIMWSVGNEIGETSDGAKSVTTVTNLKKWVEEIDDTRFVTMGDDKFRPGMPVTGNHENVSDILDIVGLNYAENNYDFFHQRHSDWIMYGSETSSATKSRGVYTHVDEQGSQHRHENPAYNGAYQQSSADNDHVGWGKTATDSWKPDRDRKYILGQFIWTGFDYIGEATPWHNTWPPKSSYFGIVDTAGFPKDDYYLYQSQWLDVKDNPMVHIMPHWNWSDSKLVDDLKSKDGKIPVRIYSNAPKVELFLNGNSLGEKAFVQKTTSDGRPYQEGPNLGNTSLYGDPLYLEWRLDYTPGELKAVAKDAADNIIATDIVRTAGEPAKVKLTPERTVIDADGYDLCYIAVDITDKNGNIVPTADNLVNFKISGNGKIVGVDNGDAVSHERYKDTKRKAFSGKALVIVQSTKNAGPFTISATSSGLTSDAVTGYTVEAGSSEDQILGYSAPLVIQTEKGVMPSFPSVINAIYSDGSTREVSVEWDLSKITLDKLNTAGTFEVTGTVSNGETLVVTVLVKGLMGLLDVKVVTLVGKIPVLPSSVKIMNNDGTEETANVTWDSNITADQVAAVGTFEILGTVDGYNQKAKAIIRVTDQRGFANIATRIEGSIFPRATASYEQGSDFARNINDGIFDGSASRWTNWSNGIANQETDWAALEFEEVNKINGASIYFFTDGATKIPAKLEIEYGIDGINYTNIVVVEEGLKSGENKIDFGEVVEAKFVRFKLTGQPNGDGTFKPVGIEEVFIYGESDIPVKGTKALLSEINLDGKPMEGFAPEVFNYNLDLKYGEKMPVVTAKAIDYASMFIVPPSIDGDSAIIKVVSEDGLSENKYVISPNALPITVGKAELKTGKTEYKEDELIDTNLTVTLEDGKVLKPGAYTVLYTASSEDGGSISLVNEKPYAFSKGTIKLKAIVTYNEQSFDSNEVQLTIKQNLNDKVAINYSSPSIEVKKGVKPQLPETVTAMFDNGILREVSVAWDEFPEVFNNKYGTYSVQGTVQGQLLKPIAKVKVRDIIAVEQFKSMTVANQIPIMPKMATLYYSDNTSTTSTITWDSVDVTKLQNAGDTVVVEGTVEGTDLKAVNTIIVGSATKKDKNISRQWTGSEFPAAMAGWTNDGSGSTDRVTNINDNDLNDSSRWTDWNSGGIYTENWVGILFAEGGTITKQYVNNMHIKFFEDSGTSAPESYTIEYYTQDGLTNDNIPKNASDRAHMYDYDANHPLNNDANWAPVANVSVINGIASVEPIEPVDSNSSGESISISPYSTPAFPVGVMNEINFDTVYTHAIRIKMNKRTDYKGIAVVELQVFAEEAVTDTTYNVNSIKLDGSTISNFNEATMDYEVILQNDVLPEITVDVTNNALVNIIPAGTSNGTAKVIVAAEDGTSNVKTYNIKFKYDVPEKNIAEVEQPEVFEIPLEVSQGTPAETVKAMLPQTITAKLDNEEKVSFKVDWDMSTYDERSLNTQIVKGNIILSNSEVITLAIDDVYYNIANLEAYAKIQPQVSPEYKQITINDVTGGTAIVKVDKQAAKPDETVIITVSNIEDGKAIDTVSVKTTAGVSIPTTIVTENEKYMFTMPADNVVIDVSLKEAGAKYKVTIGNTEGGTADVAADKTEASKDEEVKVTISNIESGKVFNSISVKTKDGTLIQTTVVTADKEYKFTMPDSDVTITVVLRDVNAPVVKHKVIIGKTEGGTADVTTDKIEANKDEEVKVTIDNIESGKVFNGISVKTTDGTLVQTTAVTANKEYKFTMPDSDVTITVSLRDANAPVVKHKVTIGKTEGGTADVTVNKAEANYNEEVEITVSNIQSGYYLDKIKVMDINGNLISVNTVISGQKYKFTMPDSDVIVTAVLLEGSEPEGLNIGSDVSGGSADITFSVNNQEVTQALPGQKVVVSISNIQKGRLFKMISVKDSDNNTIPTSALIVGTKYSFTMPSKDVTVYLNLRPRTDSSSSSSSGGGGGSSSSSDKDKKDETTTETTTDSDKNESNNNDSNDTGSKTRFTDISNHWAKSAIEFVVERELFKGITNTEFAPNQTMTRGMFVTVLGRLYGLDTSSVSEVKFSDVDKNMYYAPYIAWANENKIVAGISSDIFAPNEPITREQMAVMFANYIKFAELDLKSDYETKEFSDNADISSWAKESVKAMQSMNILSGRPDNTFDPKGTATRAEVASIIERLVKSM